MAAAPVSHDTMAMHDHDMTSPADEDCAACTADSEPAPCDAGMTGPCATMISCATATVDSPTEIISAVQHGYRPIQAVESRPASLTLSPETPPPRA